MNKKIRAFTLVELLSIITILGVMTILVVPQIGGSVSAKKAKELEKIIGIIENAGKAYHLLNKDEYKITVDTLVNTKYLSSILENPVTGEKLDECVRVIKGDDNIFSYKYTSCESILVPFDVKLNGGTAAQSFEKEYYDSTKIILKNPTKENFDFSHWEIVKGNSILDGDVLIIGDTDTILYAVWKNYPTLTVDLDEGKTTQSFSTYYKSGTTIELVNPTKEGYIFIGWEVKSGNSIISGSNFTMGSENTVIQAQWKEGSLITTYSCANGSVGDSPYNFTYTGDCEVIDDGNDNWRIKFLTSGTFTPMVEPLIDVFLVGGGGNGVFTTSGGGAGGGGFTTTLKNLYIKANESYEVVVGNATEDSTGFGSIAKGGYSANTVTGGAGGSGGGSGIAAGGSDGGNGGAYSNNYIPGNGQGTTTREFGEVEGTLYAGGGGGGPSKSTSSGAGGSGGGGEGGTYGSSGLSNTGGGGGGGYSSAGSGGSGIVIIRNAREKLNPVSIPKFTYTGTYQIVNESNIEANGSYDNWKIRFLTSGTLTFTELNGASDGIDVFLVGGGGNGALHNSGGGGGGGGYTITSKNIDVSTNVSYEIVVGDATEDSTGFGIIAKGGYSGDTITGGVGGSGGGSGIAVGGSDGGNGGSYSNNYILGNGQGTTTREFGEADGALYAGGGGGGASSVTLAGNGGLGGGGAGARGSGSSGMPNTGGGGGGGGTVSAGSGGSGIVIIRNAREKLNPVSIPKFTYTGTYQIVNESNIEVNGSYDNWKIRFLTSGTLTFTELNGASDGIDVFLVGGGGNGALHNSGGGGGGGGYTITSKNIDVSTNVSYEIVVGNATEDSTGFGATAKGGYSASSISGGNGGSGGGSGVMVGGSDGGNGGSYSTNYIPGNGQGTTTREFGEADGALYAGGGGGGAGSQTSVGMGGLGGGGAGGRGSGSSGMPNTGGGGGGGGTVSAGSGGSGIVIIRNAR